MIERIDFETPENVLLAYHPAGLGTRFLAWLFDILILALILPLVILLLLVFSGVGETLIRDMEETLRETPPGQPPVLPLYAMGLVVLVGGLGSFVYFGVSEYLWRGQTLGKRRMGLRVVKEDGFSLDGTSILVRNVFRVIDHVPALWLVPLLSRKSQRLGDMVAGTVLVCDAPTEEETLRAALLRRPPAEGRYGFAAPALARLRPADREAAERLLERWDALAASAQESHARTICETLAKRLCVSAPPETDRRRFLEDLLAAAFRAEHRRLG